MTRLFREGRTETVRPCTIESSQWVKAMQNESTSVSWVFFFFLSFFFCFFFDPFAAPRVPPSWAALVYSSTRLLVYCTLQG